MSGNVRKRFDYSPFRFLNFSYTWTIRTFRLSPEEEMLEPMRSPTFSVETNEKWYLEVHRINEESSRYLSVYLGLLSCPKSHISASFEFKAINSKGDVMQRGSSPRIYEFHPGSKEGFREFIYLDDQLFLSNDSLTLICKVNVVQGLFRFSDRSGKPRMQVPECTLADDLGELWENSRFTDCCLVVAGQEFRAHKAILAARSPVFRAMFEHDMVESRTNRVEIPDLEPQVFKAMMDFIYTGKVPTLHSMADALLVAADKYGLEGLKFMCEDTLCRDVSVENAAHTLFLADLHSAGQLKTQALEFIAAHASEVSETSSWKRMEGSHPHLVAEAYSFQDSLKDPVLERCLKSMVKPKDPNKLWPPLMLLNQYPVLLSRFPM